MCARARVCVPCHSVFKKRMNSTLSKYFCFYMFLASEETAIVTRVRLLISCKSMRAHVYSYVWASWHVCANAAAFIFPLIIHK